MKRDGNVGEVEVEGKSEDEGDWWTSCTQRRVRMRIYASLLPLSLPYHLLHAPPTPYVYLVPRTSYLIPRTHACYTHRLHRAIVYEVSLDLARSFQPCGARLDVPV